VKGVPLRKISIARNTAVAACDQAFKNPAEQRACNVGTGLMITALAKEKEIEMGKPMMIVSLGKVNLGFFQNCADKCPEGTEKVAIKKNSKGEPLTCVCRLDPNTRKKFRGQHKVPDAQWLRRKPLHPKKAVPLRRCIEVFETGPKKGMCKKEGLPTIELKPIRR
jgi:hypothetical protein